METTHQKGHKHRYIDGGVTVQNFLKEDLIDELIITIIPTLLGGGTPLFGELPEQMAFEHVKTEVFLNAIVQNHYRRKK
jgi:dihydrofolate reductase